MFKRSRSRKPHSFPIELVAELDALCVERDRARGTNQGPDGALRDQRIEELQTALLECPQPIRGSVLAGARLERVIKAGSLGTVWRATGVDSGVSCAVKVFHQNCAGRGRMLQHFRLGMAALRALTAAGAPPSIVQFFEADDSQLAFSMTLVPGHDLSDIASRGWTMEKKMQVFSGICEAVRFAHQRGIIHRDIRPANILYDEKTDGPVLTDFDLTDPLALETTTTATSRWLYAAPEQRRGGRERLLESDIYSLGRLLQYLITETPPEAGTELTVGDEPIARIIATCTRAEPGERYGDVDELQGEVRRWRAGLGVTAARQSPHRPTQIPPQELPALTLENKKAGTSWNRIMAWSAALALLGTVITYSWDHRSELGWGSTAAQPAPPPDAGAVPAPEKNRGRTPKRTRAPNPDKSDPAPAIPNDAIGRLFRENSAAFQQCHSGVELPVADLTGRVITRFRVDAEGVLSEARLVETTVKATAVAKCVAAAHNGLRLYKKPSLPTYAQSRYDIGPD
jgi:serine/threonine protein kinase